MTNAKRPKLEFLDLYRAFGIMAVIAIHVTSFPMVQLEKGTWQQAFYQFINNGSNFAVPSFLFLSGLVLFYNYFHRSADRTWIVPFYKKRLMYILVPYLIWSFFYYLMAQVMNGSGVIGNLDMYFQRLLTGKNYTHLYYFIIILQFYVLFPLLLQLSAKAFVKKWLIPFAVLVQIAFFAANKLFFHFDQTGILFITYFLHFIAGAYIGIYYEKAFAALKRNTAIITAVFIAGTLLYVYASKMYYQWLPALLPYKANLNFVIYYVFTVSACLFLLLASQWMYGLRSLKSVNRVLQSIGIASFLIFLAHPFVLAVWRQYVTSHFGAYYHYLTWLGGAVSLALSWAAFAVARKIRGSWIFIGK
ncbi:acyltransferase [Paenibacillus thermotolerans]|uniref:acyltransferase n=1 Tax=Paenibacillus thermotolerans TaxID=3027807 RepID=UPI00236886F9|nr:MULTISPECIES: acyltransferase [unclassified Paenibacillus]